MPMPRKDESKKDFLARCMDDDEAKQDFPDSDQRYAFCNSQWDERDKGEGATGRYRHIVHGVHSANWAIVPEKLQAILAFLDLRVAGVPTPFDAARPAKLKAVRGNVAVLSLYGVLAQRMNMITEASGGTSTDMFGAAFDEMMADDTVGAIVIDVDSPGGEVYGLEELSDRIFNARGTKPIYAVANSLMASAAYYVGSAADKIIVTPGGEVGSIGTVAVHVDKSAADEAAGLKYTLITAGKHKAEGSQFEPLDDETRGTIQKRVDEYYGMFVDAVARNRGVQASAVRSGYGEGRVLGAQESLKAGMVDRISTLDAVLAEITQAQRAKATAARRASIRRRSIGNN